MQNKNNKKKTKPNKSIGHELQLMILSCSYNGNVDSKTALKDQVCAYNFCDLILIALPQVEMNGFFIGSA